MEESSELPEAVAKPRVAVQVTAVNKRIMVSRQAQEKEDEDESEKK
jgi:hypothetical protein